MNSSSRESSQSDDGGDECSLAIATLNVRQISYGLPAAVEADATFIEAALSYYWGGPASDDVKEAWARLVAFMRGF